MHATHPLRLLSISDLLDTAFQLYRAQDAAGAAIAAVLSAP